MSFIAVWICRWKGHVYRRAHKGQDANLKFCKRCGASKGIVARKKQQETK